ncbi:hypothetical protein [Thaumasiovibrio sp. DFM-14]|uniref:hypothetical protein n=1 Tax=Thaumasiovibrio sp. DFM-14 TaxID=3384792 RepID=UPI0039A03DE6
MQTKFTLLEHARKTWMYSHVEEAEFPTPESIAGLSLYKAYNAPSGVKGDLNKALSLYEVDCHPLTIRYARLFSEQWDTDDQALLIEYLTQIDKDNSGKAKLYLGYKDGAPSACGMIYGDDSDYIIADVYGRSDADANSLIKQLTEQESRRRVFAEDD